MYNNEFMIENVMQKIHNQSFEKWVGILDLNALRMKYDRKKVPTKIIEEEIGSEDWDLIGIGGLTTVYNRIKELAPIIKKISPSSVFLGGGGWSSYNPDEILE